VIKTLNSNQSLNFKTKLIDITISNSKNEAWSIG
jgi:hypothetical protein